LIGFIDDNRQPFKIRAIVAPANESIISVVEKRLKAREQLSEMIRR